MSSPVKSFVEVSKLLACIVPARKNRIDLPGGDLSLGSIDSVVPPLLHAELLWYPQKASHHSCFCLESLQGLVSVLSHFHVTFTRLQLLHLIRQNFCVATMFV